MRPALTPLRHSVRNTRGIASTSCVAYLTDKDEEERLISEAYSHYPVEVEASHIMVALGKTPEEREKNKALLDSIRTAAVGGGFRSPCAQIFH